MHPILFNIGSIPVFSYGFFMAIGYLAALALLIYLGKPYGINAFRAVDLSFYSLFFGLIGARLTFLIIHPELFTDSAFKIFTFWSGGLVFYGGFLAAALFAYFFSKRHHLPLLPLLDLGAISICLSHAFGRVGCFLAGCCHGNACALPWAVTMDSELVASHLRNTPIHPVQLYESALLFMLFTFLFVIMKKKASLPKSLPHGLVAALYLGGYAIIRFVLEYFRGDTMRGYWIEGVISTSQGIAIVLFLISLLMFWKLLRGSAAKHL